MQEGEKESNSTQYNSRHYLISHSKRQQIKISYGKIKKDNTQKRGKNVRIAHCKIR